MVWKLRLTGNKHEEIFWGDDNFLYLDKGWVIEEFTFI